MIGVTVILEGDGALQDWANECAPGKPATYIAGEDCEARAVYLADGMASGLPSCMIAVRATPGDEPVVIQMSLVMFLTIARAFTARAEYEGVVLP